MVVRTVAMTVLLAACLSACSSHREAEPRPARPGALVAEAAGGVDPHFDGAVLAAARAYGGWTRLGHVAWAPVMCSPPAPADLSTTPMLSASIDEGTHGRKLYYLFVKDDVAYGLAERVGTPVRLKELRTASNMQPVGQAIVKQSWWPREATSLDTSAVRGSDGEHYVAGEPGPLFVMLKLDPLATGTDNGWVYATLTSDGSKITASGRIASCMGCHTRAGHDRVFGLSQKVR